MREFVLFVVFGIALAAGWASVRRHFLSLRITAEPVRRVVAA